jgi:hypothetical protein
MIENRDANVAFVAVVRVERPFEIAVHAGRQLREVGGGGDVGGSAQGEEAGRGCGGGEGGDDGRPGGGGDPTTPELGVWGVGGGGGVGVGGEVVGGRGTPRSAP